MFLISKSTQASKKKQKNRIQKKQKKLKKTREYLQKIDLKKSICGRLSEDFSRHLHFRKQDFFFFFFRPYFTALESHILVAPNLIN